jgi:hypothetical protein
MCITLFCTQSTNPVGRLVPCGVCSAIRMDDGHSLGGSSMLGASMQVCSKGRLVLVSGGSEQPWRGPDWGGHIALAHYAIAQNPCTS